MANPPYPSLDSEDFSFSETVNSNGNLPQYFYVNQNSGKRQRTYFRRTNLFLTERTFCRFISPLTEAGVFSAIMIKRKASGGALHPASPYFIRRIDPFENEFSDELSASPSGHHHPVAGTEGPVCNPARRALQALEACSLQGESFVQCCRIYSCHGIPPLRLCVFILHRNNIRGTVPLTGLCPGIRGKSFCIFCVRPSSFPGNVVE